MAESMATLHASFKDFRSAALIGVASLSLAACGGGDSTVQTQPAPTDRVPPDTQTPDCTAVPRPAACPDPEPVAPSVPMPLEALNVTERVLVSSSINSATDWGTILFGQRDDKTLSTVVDRERTGDAENTRVAKLIPTGNVDYTFSLYLSGALSAERTVINSAVPEENKIFSVNNDYDGYTATAIDLGFGDEWDSKILRAKVNSEKDGEKDAMLHAEVWTNYSGITDYLVGGWWAIIPDDASDASTYNFGAFSQGNILYVGASGGVPDAVTGKATYKGLAIGLHTSLEDGTPEISRLLGKVTMTANFGNATQRGYVQGKVYDLTLNGNEVDGEIGLGIEQELCCGNIGTGTSTLAEKSGLPSTPDRPVGYIDNILYSGSWGGGFYGGGKASNDPPTGIAGVVQGRDRSGNNSFAASFGAKKVETGE